MSEGKQKQKFIIVTDTKGRRIGLDTANIKEVCDHTWEGKAVTRIDYIAFSCSEFYMVTESVEKVVGMINNGGK